MEKGGRRRGVGGKCEWGGRGVGMSQEESNLAACNKLWKKH